MFIENELSLEVARELLHTQSKMEEGNGCLGMIAGRGVQAQKH
jgi:hypothetical protein